MTTLNIPHLRQVWLRNVEQKVPTAANWQADQIVLHGLGVGMHEALRFMHKQRPSYDDFVRWIIGRNNGEVDANRSAWINDAVERALGSTERAGLPDDFEPVFDDSDLRNWDNNGYVILKDAVSPDAAEAAATAIWEHLGMDRNEPDGWYTGAESEGIFVTVTRHPAFDANRASLRIRRAFAQLLGTNDLVMNIDRVGFNPPERQGGKFRGQGLHWDISVAPPVHLRIQSLLYLTDTPAEQGAFQCVPGFHRRIDDWVAALPVGAVPREQDLSAEAIPLPGKAGDLVLWHAALPHGATPNRGVAARLVQYIAYYCVTDIDTRPWR